MKKITNLLMVLMLMASIVALAITVEADDNNQENPGMGIGYNKHPFDNETEREIRVMNNSLGARIRLLQLEKAIILNILKGDMTVEVLQGFNISINTTKLEKILENLTEVLGEVRTADPDANDSVQIFVQLKNESKNLTKQFRDTVRQLLNNETIALIKEELKNIYSDELQNCSMKIRHWVRQFNRNQLYRLFEFVGEANTSLLDEYLDGEINLTQVRLHLYPLVNQMTKQKRYMLFSEIKEENITNKIQAQESMKHMGSYGRDHGRGGRP